MVIIILRTDVLSSFLFPRASTYPLSLALYRHLEQIAWGAHISVLYRACILSSMKNLPLNLSNRVCELMCFRPTVSSVIFYVFLKSSMLALGK